MLWNVLFCIIGLMLSFRAQTLHQSDEFLKNSDKTKRAFVFDDVADFDDIVESLEDHISNYGAINNADSKSKTDVLEFPMVLTDTSSSKPYDVIAKEPSKKSKQYERLKTHAYILASLNSKDSTDPPLLLKQRTVENFIQSTCTESSTHKMTTSSCTTLNTTKSETSKTDFHQKHLQGSVTTTCSTHKESSSPTTRPPTKFPHKLQQETTKDLLTNLTEDLNDDTLLKIQPVHMKELIQVVEVNTATTRSESTTTCSTNGHKQHPRNYEVSDYSKIDERSSRNEKRDSLPNSNFIEYINLRKIPENNSLNTKQIEDNVSESPIFKINDEKQHIDDCQYKDEHLTKKTVEQALKDLKEVILNDVLKSDQQISPTIQTTSSISPHLFPQLKTRTPISHNNMDNSQNEEEVAGKQNNGLERHGEKQRISANIDGHYKLPFTPKETLYLLSSNTRPSCTDTREQSGCFGSSPLRHKSINAANSNRGLKPPLSEQFNKFYSETPKNARLLQNVKYTPNQFDSNHNQELNKLMSPYSEVDSVKYDEFLRNVLEQINSLQFNLKLKRNYARKFDQFNPVHKNAANYNPNVPVHVHTGYLAPLRDETYKKTPNVYYLLKPFNSKHTFLPVKFRESAVKRKRRATNNEYHAGHQFRPIISNDMIKVENKVIPIASHFSTKNTLKKSKRSYSQNKDVLNYLNNAYKFLGELESFEKNLQSNDLNVEGTPNTLKILTREKLGDNQVQQKSPFTFMPLTFTYHPEVKTESTTSAPIVPVHLDSMFLPTIKTVEGSLQNPLDALNMRKLNNFQSQQNSAENSYSFIENPLLKSQPLDFSMSDEPKRTVDKVNTNNEITVPNNENDGFSRSTNFDNEMSSIDNQENSILEEQDSNIFENYNLKSSLTSPAITKNPLWWEDSFLTIVNSEPTLKSGNSITESENEVQKKSDNYKDYYYIYDEDYDISNSKINKPITTKIKRAVRNFMENTPSSHKNVAREISETSVKNDRDEDMEMTPHSKSVSSTTIESVTKRIATPVTAEVVCHITPKSTKSSIAPAASGTVSCSETNDTSNHTRSWPESALIATLWDSVTSTGVLNKKKRSLDYGNTPEIAFKTEVNILKSKPLRNYEWFVTSFPQEYDKMRHPYGIYKSPHNLGAYIPMDQFQSSTIPHKTTDTVNRLLRSNLAQDFYDYLGNYDEFQNDESTTNKVEKLKRYLDDVYELQNYLDRVSFDRKLDGKMKLAKRDAGNADSNANSNSDVDRNLISSYQQMHNFPHQNSKKKLSNSYHPQAYLKAVDTFRHPNDLYKNRPYVKYKNYNDISPESNYQSNPNEKFKTTKEEKEKEEKDVEKTIRKICRKYSRKFFKPKLPKFAVTSIDNLERERRDFSVNGPSSRVNFVTAPTGRIIKLKKPTRKNKNLLKTATPVFGNEWRPKTPSVLQSSYLNNDSVHSFDFITEPTGTVEKLPNTTTTKVSVKLTYDWNNFTRIIPTTPTLTQFELINAPITFSAKSSTTSKNENLQKETTNTTFADVSSVQITSASLFYTQNRTTIVIIDNSTQNEDYESDTVKLKSIEDDILPSTTHLQPTNISNASEIQATLAPNTFPMTTKLNLSTTRNVGKSTSPGGVKNLSTTIHANSHSASGSNNDMFGQVVTIPLEGLDEDNQISSTENWMLTAIALGGYPSGNITESINLKQSEPAKQLITANIASVMTSPTSDRFSTNSKEYPENISILATSEENAINEAFNNVEKIYLEDLKDVVDENSERSTLYSKNLTSPETKLHQTTAKENTKLSQTEGIITADFSISVKSAPFLEQSDSRTPITRGPYQASPVITEEQLTRISTANFDLLTTNTHSETPIHLLPETSFATNIKEEFSSISKTTETPPEDQLFPEFETTESHVTEAVNFGSSQLYTMETDIGLLPPEKTSPIRQHANETKPTEIDGKQYFTASTNVNNSIYFDLLSRISNQTQMVTNQIKETDKYKEHLKEMLSPEVTRPVAHDNLSEGITVTHKETSRISETTTDKFLFENHLTVQSLPKGNSTENELPIYFNTSSAPIENTASSKFGHYFPVPLTSVALTTSPGFEYQFTTTGNVTEITHFVVKNATNIESLQDASSEMLVLKEEFQNMLKTINPPLITSLNNSTTNEVLQADNTSEVSAASSVFRAYITEEPQLVSINVITPTQINYSKLLETITATENPLLIKTNTTGATAHSPSVNIDAIARLDTNFTKTTAKGEKTTTNIHPEMTSSKDNNLNYSSDVLLQMFSAFKTINLNEDNYENIVTPKLNMSLQNTLSMNTSELPNREQNVVNNISDSISSEITKEYDSNENITFNQFTTKSIEITTSFVYSNSPSEMGSTGTKSNLKITGNESLSSFPATEKANNKVLEDFSAHETSTVGLFVDITDNLQSTTSLENDTYQQIKRIRTSVQEITQTSKYNAGFPSEKVNNENLSVHETSTLYSTDVIGTNNTNYKAESHLSQSFPITTENLRYIYTNITTIQDSLNSIDTTTNTERSKLFHDLMNSKLFQSSTAVDEIIGDKLSSNIKESKEIEINDDNLKHFSVHETSTICMLCNDTEVANGTTERLLTITGNLSSDNSNMPEEGTVTKATKSVEASQQGRSDAIAQPSIYTTENNEMPSSYTSKPLIFTHDTGITHVTPEDIDASANGTSKEHIVLPIKPAEVDEEELKHFPAHETSTICELCNSTDTIDEIKSNTTDISVIHTYEPATSVTTIIPKENLQQQEFPENSAIHLTSPGLSTMNTSSVGVSFDFDTGTKIDGVGQKFTEQVQDEALKHFSNHETSTICVLCNATEVIGVTDESVETQSTHDFITPLSTTISDLGINEAVTQFHKSELSQINVASTESYKITNNNTIEVDNDGELKHFSNHETSTICVLCNVTQVSGESEGTQSLQNSITNMGTGRSIFQLQNFSQETTGLTLTTYTPQLPLQIVTDNTSEISTSTSYEKAVTSETNNSTIEPIREDNDEDLKHFSLHETSTICVRCNATEVIDTSNELNPPRSQLLTANTESISPHQHLTSVVSSSKESEVVQKNVINSDNYSSTNRITEEANDEELKHFPDKETSTICVLCNATEAIDTSNELNPPRSQLLTANTESISPHQHLTSVVSSPKESTVAQKNVMSSDNYSSTNRIIEEANDEELKHFPDKETSTICVRCNVTEVISVNAESKRIQSLEASKSTYSAQSSDQNVLDMTSNPSTIEFSLQNISSISNLPQSFHLADKSEETHPIEGLTTTTNTPTTSPSLEKDVVNNTRNNFDTHVNAISSEMATSFVLPTEKINNDELKHFSHHETSTICSLCNSTDNTDTFQSSDDIKLEHQLPTTLSYELPISSVENSAKDITETSKFDNNNKITLTNFNRLEDEVVTKIYKEPKQNSEQANNDELKHFFNHETSTICVFCNTTESVTVDVHSNSGGTKSSQDSNDSIITSNNQTTERHNLTPERRTQSSVEKNLTNVPISFMLNVTFDVHTSSLIPVEIDNDDDLKHFPLNETSTICAPCNDTEHVKSTREITTELNHSTPEQTASTSNYVALHSEGDTTSGTSLNQKTPDYNALIKYTNEMQTNEMSSKIDVNIDSSSTHLKEAAKVNISNELTEWDWNVKSSEAYHQTEHSPIAVKLTSITVNISEMLSTKQTEATTSHGTMSLTEKAITYTTNPSTMITSASVTDNLVTVPEKSKTTKSKQVESENRDSITSFLSSEHTLSSLERQHSQSGSSTDFQNIPSQEKFINSMTAITSNITYEQVTSNISSTRGSTEYDTESYTRSSSPSYIRPLTFSKYSTQDWRNNQNATTHKPSVAASTVEVKYETSHSTTYGPIYLSLPIILKNSTASMESFEKYYSVSTSTTVSPSIYDDEATDYVIDKNAFRSMKYGDFEMITEFPPTTSTTGQKSPLAELCNVTSKKFSTRLTHSSAVEMEVTSSKIAANVQYTTQILSQDSTTKSTEGTLVTEMLTTLKQQVSEESTTIATISTENVTHVYGASSTLTYLANTTNKSTLSIVNEKFTKTQEESTCNNTDFLAHKHCLCSIDSLIKDLKTKAYSNIFSMNFNNYSCPVLSNIDSEIVLGNDSSIRITKKDSGTDSHIKKREVVENSDIEKRLGEGLELKNLEHEIFGVSGKSVQMSCSYLNNSIPDNQVTNYSWTIGDNLPLTEGRMQEKDGILTIENLSPQDGGSYTCLLTTGIGNSITSKKFDHHLSVITLPAYASTMPLLYNTSEKCEKQDIEIISLLLPNMLGNLICGKQTKVCNIEVGGAHCLDNSENYISFNLTTLIEPMNKIIPTTDAPSCDVNCEMQIYSKLVSFIVKNLENLPKLPVIFRLSYRQQKLFPTEILNEHTKNEFRIEAPKLIITCPPGFGYLRRTRICGACSRNMYSRGSETYCTVCPAGQYQPMVGSKSCLTCSSPLQDPYCLRVVYSNTDKFKILIGVAASILIFILIMLVCIRNKKIEDKSDKYDKLNRYPSRKYSKKRFRDEDIEKQDSEPLLPLSDKNRNRRYRDRRKPPEPPPPDFL